VSRVGLRIDVDFPVGLRRGVPWLLDRLAERRMRATFFVVAGRNSARRVLRHAVDRQYFERLLRLGPVRIARCLGISAWRDEGFLDTSEARRVVDRVLDEGHEVAAHGYDHAWWADEVWRADPTRLVAEIDLACDRLERTIGAAGLAWGSPSWRTSDVVLHHLERRGVPYLAECWGREPFRTLDDAGRAIRVPHLPVSLPSLEAQVLAGRRDARVAIGGVLAAVDAAAATGVLCAHDYFEGLLRRDLFVGLLDGLAERGVETVPLRDTARDLAGAVDTLPACRIVRAPAAGFHGYVSWQGATVRAASGEPAPALVAHAAERGGDEE